jgi:PAS domain-containing protein
MESPLLVVDHHNRFLSLNVAARRVLNIDHEERVDGKPVQEFIQNQALVSFILQTAEDDNTLDSEMELTGQNGRSYQVHLKLIRGGGRSVRLEPL